MLELLCRELELGANDVYQVDAPLDLSGLWDLYSLRRPELKYPTFTPQNPPPLAGGKDSDVFWAMRNGDVLLHHPYDSFANSVEAFVEQAASDRRGARDQADAVPHRRRRGRASSRRS